MATREPMRRSGHAAVGIGSKLYVWGGNSSIVLSKPRIETFDVPAVAWERAQVLRDSDMPCDLFDMAVTSDGETSYFFGGQTDLPSREYHDTLFQMTPSRLLCQKLRPSTTFLTAPENMSRSGIVQFKDMLILYGGKIAPKIQSNKMYIFDLERKVWKLQQTTGDKPPPLTGHTFTKIDHKRAVVIGGLTGTNFLSDPYVLDIETWHWTKLVTGGKFPGRYNHATCYIAGPLTGQQHPILMVVGGCGDKYQVFGDVWLLDVDKGTWTKLALPVAITQRYCHSAVAFGSGPSCRVVVLFGGRDCFVTSNLSETTMLLLELKRGTWRVPRVVKPDELGKPDDMLREHMRKSELSPQEELQAHSTATDATFSSTAHKDTLSVLPPQASEVEAKTSPTIDVNELRMGKRLGQGGFGTVYEAKWKKRVVAAKVCPGNLLENLTREIEILASLPPHPHLLKFFGVALSSDGVSTYIVTELAANGSLYDYLHDKKVEPSPDQSLAWAQQIASGMQHLHDNSVVHRDLKSGNVLLALGLLAKVCDFGTARTMTKTAKTTQKGTYRWMAPEIIEDVEANINKMCDVFSYGMVLYEIYDRKIPFADIPGDAVAGMAVLQGKRPPIPASLPPYLCPVLEACWNKDPNQRPQFEAIVLAIQTQSFD